MSQTLEISTETAAMVESQADLAELSVDDYLRSLLPNVNGDNIEKTPNKTTGSDERARAFRAWVESQKSDAPPIPLESLRRENLY